MTCAVNAGVSDYKGSGYLDPDDMPIKMATVPVGALPELNESLDLYGQYDLWAQQLLALSHAAMGEALGGYQETTPLPLILSLPEFYPQYPHTLPSNFLHCLTQQTGLQFDLEMSRLLHTGRAGGIEAFQLAAQLLNETELTHVLVGGVDSYQRPALLKGLFNERRITSLLNGDGFVPGEGASFILLSTAPDAALGSDELYPVLGEVGLAEEPGHLYSEHPYRGEGLDRAVKQATSGYSQPKISNIYAGVNGENFWAKELSISINRNRQHIADKYTIHHPAEYYGDLGSASAPTMVGVAVRNMLQQPHPRSTLVLCSSDYAPRGALTLHTEKISE